MAGLAPAMWRLDENNLMPVVETGRHVSEDLSDASR